VFRAGYKRLARSVQCAPADRLQGSSATRPKTSDSTPQLKNAPKRLGRIIAIPLSGISRARQLSTRTGTAPCALRLTLTPGARSRNFQTNP
jgi:hypothetical protein